MRETLNLDGPWRFQPDPYGEGDRDGYEKAGFDDSAWLEVDVPSGFCAALPELEFYEGGGWYRRSLVVPESMRGRWVVVRFEGVNYRCRVWLNGRLVGEHMDGYLRFELPVGDALEYGSLNSLVVYADNTCYPEDLPGVQRGWRTIGGLVRSVSLVSMSRVHLGHVSSSCGVDGSVVVRARIENECGESASCVVTARIAEATGHAGLALESETINAGCPGPALVDLSGTLDDANPWSPDSPTLYDLTVSLSLNGKVVDSESCKVGFRTVAARDEKLVLNGEPVYLKGFNRHEDSPRSAMSPDTELTRQDLTAMKESGANFVRLCHYPHDPGELDLCDELGLLVMDEIPLYWWTGQWDEEHYAAKLAAARRQLEKMITRDVNHPSVIFWSVSNETAENAPGVVEGNRELVKLAKEMDSTRPAVHVSNHWTEVREFDDDDVICINAYPAWGRMHKGGQGGFTLEDATAWWADELEKLHECYADKPILVAEFGHPCLPGVQAGALGESTQAAALEAEFAAMQAPYVCGAIVWCYADHPWPGGFDFVKFLTLSPYGVVTRDRRRKQGFDVVKKLFQDCRVD